MCGSGCVWACLTLGSTGLFQGLLWGFFSDFPGGSMSELLHRTPLRGLRFRQAFVGFGC